MKHSINTKIPLPKTGGCEGAFAGMANNSVSNVVHGRLIWLYPAAILIMMLLMLVGKRYGIDFAVFTKDPLTVANGRAYFGLLSNLGVLLWCATATLCLFTGGIQSAAEHGRRRCFLLASGWLTLVLLFDDLFMLHEDVFPAVLGIRQRYVMMLYLTAFASYLVVFRKEIARSSYLYLLVSLTCFSLSLGEDLVMLAAHSWHYLLEDGAKLLGIISWFVYFSHIAREEVRTCIVNKSI